MSPRIVALLVVAALGACTASPPPPTKTTQSSSKAAGTTEPKDEAKPAAPSEPEFVYSGAGKRDPFRSYLAELARETGTFSSKCQGPLGKLEIEQMKLVAVITGLEDPVAMVQVPGGDGFVIRRGACIGKNGGVVAAVRTGEVVVTEYRVRADGTRDAIQTSIQLPKPPPLTEE